MNVKAGFSTVAPHAVSDMELCPWKTFLVIALFTKTCGLQDTLT